MGHKVARTDFDSAQYARVAAVARKKGLTIREALREAALRWAEEERGINPDDPIFDIALVRKKAPSWGSGTENASEKTDETVYK